MTFGRRPTIGDSEQKDDCCEIGKNRFLSNFVEISKEALKEISAAGDREFYSQVWSEGLAFIEYVKEMSCDDFKDMLKNLVYEKGYDEMKPHEILREMENCEKGTYDRDFQNLNLSEDITMWQDTLLKDERLTKKLYEIVRDEMHSPDVFSIEDLYKKVMARWDESAKPTKEQVQKVMGYILTRGRIK